MLEEIEKETDPVGRDGPERRTQ